MKNGQVIDLGLKRFDELFMDEQAREDARRPRIYDIAVDNIDDFPKHPFKVRMDASMDELVESVREHGILIPGIVRPMPDGRYQMVSGHRRKTACIIAEMDTIPCVVREMSDDDAALIVVDSNIQREDILPSEKAFAYQMKLEAMKRQGKRTDLTSDPVGPKLDTRSNQELANQSPDSKTQIQRYIRLTHLLPEILEMVDNSVLKETGKLQMALRPAVELSYLTEGEQRVLLETMLIEDRTPSHAQAIRMRSASERGALGDEEIQEIMQEEKPNQIEQFRMPKERIAKYFPPGTPAQKMVDTIIKALELYRRRERSFER